MVGCVAVSPSVSPASAMSISPATSEVGSLKSRLLVRKKAESPAAAAASAGGAKRAAQRQQQQQQQTASAVASKLKLMSSGSSASSTSGKASSCSSSRYDGTGTPEPYYYLYCILKHFDSNNNVLLRL